GWGGVPNECGAPSCTPTTCEAQGIGCGPAGDGCGGMLDCGSCGEGQSCGAGGVPSQCGADEVCVPLVEATVCAGRCGPAGDGCGGVYDCGGCAAPASCGGGGVPGTCGAPACVPRTCAAYGATC